jgi:hypothetical protein
MKQTTKKFRLATFEEAAREAEATIQLIQDSTYSDNTNLEINPYRQQAEDALLIAWHALENAAQYEKH